MKDLCTLRRKTAPTLRIGRSDKTQLFGGVDILFTFEEPDSLSGSDCLKDLWQSIEHRAEFAGFLLDTPAEGRNENLPKLLVPTQLTAGALFPNHLLDKLALRIDIRVCRDMHPVVIKFTSGRFRRNRLWKCAQLSSTSAGSPLTR